MTSRVIENDYDLKNLVLYVNQMERPFTVEITKGRRRSVEQNRLQRLWIKEISEQMGWELEESRAYCKLVLGVPILRAENETFCAKYDAHVKDLPYPQKIAFMAEPLDMPVTRLMTVKQHREYLDAIVRHFGERGIVLTQPEQPPMQDGPR